MVQPIFTQQVSCERNLREFDPSIVQLASCWNGTHFNVSFDVEILQLMEWNLTVPVRNRNSKE